jgi:hypothetical protein
VSEKQACQLAMVNMVDVNSDNDILIAVVKKMSTSRLNQIYIHRIIKK